MYESKLKYPYRLRYTYDDGQMEFLAVVHFPSPARAGLYIPMLTRMLGNGGLGAIGFDVCEDKAYREPTDEEVEQLSKAVHRQTKAMGNECKFIKVPVPPEVVQ